jgi:hypothetical protein
VTSRILLNKWQRKIEKERYQKRRYEEEAKKRRVEGTRSSTRVSRSARTRDAPSSGTAGMRG